MQHNWILSSLIFVPGGVSAPQAASPTMAPEIVAPAYRWADFDADGLQDVYVVDPLAGDRLFENLGDGAFEDVTLSSGLSGISGSRMALWFDFDRDGAQDLYVSSATGQSRLFQNTGQGSFVDVTSLAGMEHLGGELFASIVDYDADALPDVHVVTDRGDVLFHNAGSGRFERAGLPAEFDVVRAADGATLGASSSERTAAVSGANDATPDGAADRANDRTQHSGRTRSSTSSLSFGSTASAAPIGTPINPRTATAAAAICAGTLVDQATTTCIQASSVPTIGLLYPQSTAFNITPGGDIGIGTTAPTNPVHISSNSPLALRNASTSAFGSALMLDNSSVGGNKWSVISMGSANIYSAAGNFLVLNNDTGILAQTITPFGNVGIGTNAPANRLHVVSAGSTPVRMTSSATGGTRMELENTTGARWAFNSTGSASPEGQGKLVVRDVTTGINSMTFDVNGNVGIGTTGPTVQLAVVGSVQLDFAGTNSGTTADALSFGSGANTEAIGSNRTVGVNVNGLDFYTNSVNRVQITNTGLVGIGRTPAANTLEVEGDASKLVAGSWLANSDRRIKTDVREIDGALETLERLRPVGFHYTEEFRAAHPSVKDIEYFNVIAQEFAEVFPDSVTDSGQNGILQVDTYPALIHAIAAVKELHGVVQEKQQAIEALEERLARLERAVEASTALERR